MVKIQLVHRDAKHYPLLTCIYMGVHMCKLHKSQGNGVAIVFSNTQCISLNVLYHWDAGGRGIIALKQAVISSPLSGG